MMTRFLTTEHSPYKTTSHFSKICKSINYLIDTWQFPHGVYYDYFGSLMQVQFAVLESVIISIFKLFSATEHSVSDKEDLIDGARSRDFENFLSHDQRITRFGLEARCTTLAVKLVNFVTSKKCHCMKRYN